MEKINNISFTGIKNIGIATFKRSGNEKNFALSMTLTDDFNDKDLTEFKNVLKKIAPNGSYFYRNHEHPDLLNIEGCIDKFNDHTIAVNGVYLDNLPNDIPAYSYIAKLTKKIFKMPEKEMVVSDSYKDFVANETLIHGVNILNDLDNLPSGYFDKFFDKSTVKDAAKYTNEFVQMIMNKYLGIS